MSLSKRDHSDDECSVLGAARAKRQCEVRVPMDGTFFESQPTPKILERLKIELRKQGLFRPLEKGGGLRVRDCLLCLRSSDSKDIIFGNESYLIWAHLEEDDVTINSFACKWCSDMMRRRWKGWKVEKFAKEIRQEDGALTKVGEHFTKLVDESIKQYKNGRLRITDNMLSPPLQTVENRSRIIETIGLQGDCLWSAERLAIAFPGADPEIDLNLRWESHAAPNGEVSEGYRRKDTGERGEGIIPISRSFERSTDHTTVVDDGQNSMDVRQQRDNFRNQARERFSPADKSASGEDLKKRYKKFEDQGQRAVDTAVKGKPTHAAGDVENRFDQELEDIYDDGCQYATVSTGRPGVKRATARASGSNASGVPRAAQRSVSRPPATPPRDIPSAAASIDDAPTPVPQTPASEKSTGTDKGARRTRRENTRLEEPSTPASGEAVGETTAPKRKASVFESSPMLVQDDDDGDALLIALDRAKLAAEAAPSGPKKQKKTEQVKENIQDEYIKLAKSIKNDGLVPGEKVTPEKVQAKLTSFGRSKGCLAAKKMWGDVEVVQHLIKELAIVGQLIELSASWEEAKDLSIAAKLDDVHKRLQSKTIYEYLPIRIHRVVHEAKTERAFHQRNMPEILHLTSSDELGKLELDPKVHQIEIWKNGVTDIFCNANAKKAGAAGVREPMMELLTSYLSTPATQLDAIHNDLDSRLRVLNHVIDPYSHSYENVKASVEKIKSSPRDPIYRSFKIAAEVGADILKIAEDYADTASAYIEDGEVVACSLKAVQELDNACQNTSEFDIGASILLLEQQNHKIVPVEVKIASNAVAKASIERFAQVSFSDFGFRFVATSEKLLTVMLAKNANEVGLKFRGHAFTQKPTGHNTKNEVTRIMNNQREYLNHFLSWAITCMKDMESPLNDILLFTNDFVTLVDNWFVLQHDKPVGPEKQVATRAVGASLKTWTSTTSKHVADSFNENEQLKKFKEKVTHLYGTHIASQYAGIVQAAYDFMVTNSDFFQEICALMQLSSAGVFMPVSPESLPNPKRNKRLYELLGLLAKSPAAPEFQQKIQDATTQTTTVGDTAETVTLEGLHRLSRAIALACATLKQLGVLTADDSSLSLADPQPREQWLIKVQQFADAVGRVASFIEKVNDQGEAPKDDSKPSYQKWHDLVRRSKKMIEFMNKLDNFVFKDAQEVVAENHADLAGLHPDWRVFMLQAPDEVKIRSAVIDAEAAERNGQAAGGIADVETCAEFFNAYCKDRKFYFDDAEFKTVADLFNSAKADIDKASKVAKDRTAMICCGDLWDLMLVRGAGKASTRARQQMLIENKKRIFKDIKKEEMPGEIWLLTDQWARTGSWQE